MKHIDPARTEKHLVEFIRSVFHTAGFSRAVIALSGGVDSATSCSLAVQALGGEQVFPVLLPHGALNLQGTADAGLVAESLGIPERNIFVLDIEPLLEPFFARISDMDGLRKGNAMARMRMTILYDRAKKIPGLVLGTENKTEHYLGYYTRFGDEASDLEPLRILYKTQVYELARHLGVPEPVLNKKPSAGLWEGQTDEGEFGFTYTQADEVLCRIIDGKTSVSDVLSDPELGSVAQRVIERMNRNAFKHEMPRIPDTIEE